MAINLTGNLEGTIDLQGTIKSPVNIGGSLAQTATISLLGNDQELPAAADIVIAGALAGTVIISGDKAGDLNINPGSVSGTGRIVIGGDLESYLKIGGTVSSNARIEIDGDVLPRFSNTQPPVQLDSIVFTGASAMPAKLWIGHSLLGAVIMPLPSVGGFSGQVIVNRNDTNGVFGSTGRVRIGQPQAAGQSYNGWLNIADPEDPLLSSQIGGGAVGLVPFKLHQQDCSPAYTDVPNNVTPILLTTSFLATRPNNLPEGVVTIRSYGPMMIDTENGFSTSNAIDIEVQNPSCPTQWYAADSFFTKTYFPGGNKRIV